MTATVNKAALDHHHDCAATGAAPIEGGYSHEHSNQWDSVPKHPPNKNGPSE